MDEHLAELEEELASLEGEVEDLRTQVPSNNTVAAEIERIGEQTSAVLLAAHDEAQQTIRAARAQANDCISDAAAYAVELTEQAKRELAHAEVERAAVMRERERLLEDIRLTAAELVSLADNATARVAPEPVIPRSVAPQPVAARETSEAQDESVASAEQWVEDEQLEPGENEEGTTEN